MSTLNRDKAREVLIDCALGSDLDVVLDALAACMVDTPHTIDRDMLVTLLDNMKCPRPLRVADRILALVQPSTTNHDWEQIRRDRGWPTPNHMRSAAKGLDILSIPRYGDVLRYVADLCDEAAS